jgi:DNA repair protein RAD7
MALEKAKAAKKSKKGKSKKKKKKDSDDEDSDDSAFDIFNEWDKIKAAKLPGQLEYCELCDKRFTVTPYSKNGPDGGLLCTPCGKKQTAEEKAANKVKKKATGAARQNRRKGESNRLDGLNPLGPKSLKDLCIEKLGQYAEDVEELGELPSGVMDRVSHIFSKGRKLKPSTLPLFVRPDLEKVMVHDAACKSFCSIISHVWTCLLLSPISWHSDSRVLQLPGFLDFRFP